MNASGPGGASRHQADRTSNSVSAPFPPTSNSPPAMSSFAPFTAGQLYYTPPPSSSPSPTESQFPAGAAPGSGSWHHSYGAGPGGLYNPAAPYAATGNHTSRFLVSCSLFNALYCLLTVSARPHRVHRSHGRRASAASTRAQGGTHIDKSGTLRTNVSV